MSRLRRHWFLIAYAGVLALAWLLPDAGRSGGFFHLEAARFWCIAGIFLCAGLVLPASRLGLAMRDGDCYLRIQGVGFVIAPLLGLAVAWIAGLYGLSPAAQTGVIILACLPTTIGSCVAHTGLAGGNQSLALVNSVLGNLAGIVLTPLLVTALTHRHGTTPVATVVAQLALLSLVPVICGQLLRWRWSALLDRIQRNISVISGCLLLLIALGIFSDLAHHGLTSDALAIFTAAVCLHAALATCAWLSGRGRQRADRIAITITGAQKTAALGVPLIGLLFVGDPHVAVIAAPIVLYHAVQQATGAGAAAWFNRPAPTRTG